MIHPKPVTIEGRGLSLEPMTIAHAGDIIKAASDGNLWGLGFTSVPAPGNAEAYTVSYTHLTLPTILRV